jgi:hypothetical protein
MNIKRLILAIVAGYVVIFATDFLIHHVWMNPDYEATQQVWRAEPEMKSMMGWFIGAQIVTVITFVLLWTRWADTARLLMGAFSGAWPITLYAVLPIPCTIACKWFFAGIAQCILLGIVTFFVYKPAQTAVPLS